VANAWQYYILKGVSYLICQLPYSWLLGAGRVLGRFYYRLAAKQRERALKQIKECLGYSSQEAEAIIRRSFIHIAQAFIEIFYTPVLTKENIHRYIEIENKHYLDSVTQTGKGVAVLTGHIGNWEWLGAGLSLYGYKVASIVKRQPNDQYMRILTEIRKMVGIECYIRGTSELVGAVKALKNGRMMGFFSDQDGGYDGVFVEFLGKMSSTHAGLAVLSQRLGVPILPAFIIRKPRGGHRIIIGPPVELELSGETNADIPYIVAETTKIVEAVIRQYPEEWLWFQKRWNTQWEGEKA